MILLVFWLQFYMLYGEVTSVPKDAQDPEVAESQSCAGHEEDFRQFILLQINQSLSTFRQTANCFHSNDTNCSKIRSESLAQLKNYRKNLAQLYENVAYDHIKQRPSPELARQCLLNRVGVPEFTNSIRDIKLQIDDPTLCIGEKESFQQQLESRAEGLLSGATPSSLSADVLIGIKTFQQSPLGRELSDSSKYEKKVSDQELLKDLSRSLFQLSARIEKLRDKISILSATELYKLYEFENQFEVFKKEQPTEVVGALEACFKNSHFVKNCTLNLEFSRCGSKIWGFTKDLLPILPIIDGLQGYSDTRSAQDAGLLTSDEAAHAKVENTIKALFGFTGMTSLARGAAVKIGGASRKGLLHLDTKILSPNEKLALLAKNSELTDVSRINEISRVTGRSFSPREISEVLRAHNIGSGYFDYSPADLRKKIEILSKLGFKKDEIDELMRRGLVGGHRHSEFVKIEPVFSAVGLKLDPHHVQKSFTEKAAKKAAENIKNGQIRRMKGSDCYSVETISQMRVVLASDKKTVLFAGSHEAYNNFYTTPHFASLCR